MNIHHCVHPSGPA